MLLNAQLQHCHLPPPVRAVQLWRAYRGVFSIVGSYFWQPLCARSTLKSDLLRNRLSRSNDNAVACRAFMHAICHTDTWIYPAFEAAVGFPSLGCPYCSAVNCHLIMPKLSPEERRLCAELYAKNWSITDIGKHLNCDRKTVRDWVNRGQDSSETYEDLPRSGRSSTLSAADHKAARRMALSGQTATKVAASLSKKKQQPVSVATVIRTLATGKDPLLWVPVNRGRVLSPKNKGLRAKFCAANKNKQTGTWVFGDSKFYYMYRDGAGRLRWKWQNLQQMQSVISSGSPVVLHFYGFVAKGYKSKLYFVPPTAPAGSKARKHREAYASKHFIELLPKVKRDLKKGGKDSARHPVVLDCAKQHTSDVSKAAIQAQQLHLVKDFPAQSWDINIIENVWGVLDGKLKAMGGPFPRGPGGWCRRVRAAWKAIDQRTIDKLIRAVPKRMREIEQREGEWLFRKRSKK